MTCIGKWRRLVQDLGGAGARWVNYHASAAAPLQLQDFQVVALSRGRLGGRPLLVDLGYVEHPASDGSAE
jgi:hypothetical protein